MFAKFRLFLNLEKSENLLAKIYFFSKRKALIFLRGKKEGGGNYAGSSWPSGSIVTKNYFGTFLSLFFSKSISFIFVYCTLFSKCKLVGRTVGIWPRNSTGIVLLEKNSTTTGVFWIAPVLVENWIAHLTYSFSKICVSKSSVP